MQTRFIASQRYYGSYHCRNQSIQESRYLLPLFLLFLSSSPRSPSSLTVTRWATNRNGVSSSQLSRQHPPRFSYALNLFPSGVGSGHQPTGVPESTTVTATDGNTRSRGPPLETQEKRQRQKHAHSEYPFTRAQFPGGRFPRLWRLPTNQIRALLAHTFPRRTWVRVHRRRLRVYKGSRGAHPVIRVRVS